MHPSPRIDATAPARRPQRPHSVRCIRDVTTDAITWGGPGAVTLAPTRPMVSGRRRGARTPSPATGQRPGRERDGGAGTPRSGRRRLLLTLWLGAVVLVAAASAGTSSIPTSTGAPVPGTPVLVPQPETDPVDAARAVAAAVRDVVGSGSLGHVSVAARNVRTGRSVSYAPYTQIPTASVVKLDILATLLLDRQDAHRPLSGQAVDLATRMIQSSDNDAATALWNAVGGAPAVAATNRRLGVRNTELAPQWGSSTTCAADRIALLAHLVRPGVLGPAARSFTLSLMTNVQADQRWGISSAADRAVRPALKNGWVPLDGDGGRWVTSSTGIATVAGDPVLIAVLAEHQADQRSGIRLVEALARIAAGAVTTGSVAHDEPSGSAPAA